ncbi:hypothetical protein ACA910_013356 [Epithemia clementina (nom. ined.)]
MKPIIALSNDKEDKTPSTQQQQRTIIMPPNSQLPSKKRKTSVCSAGSNSGESGQRQQPQQPPSSPSIAATSTEQGESTTTTAAEEGAVASGSTAVAAEPSITEATGVKSASASATLPQQPSSSSVDAVAAEEDEPSNATVTEEEAIAPGLAAVAAVSSTTEASAGKSEAKAAAAPSDPPNNNNRPVSSKSNICPSRLPSKKRKGSHDSQYAATTTSSSNNSTSNHPPLDAAIAFTTTTSLRKDSTGSSSSTNNNNSNNGASLRKFSIDLSLSHNNNNNNHNTASPTLSPPRKHRANSFSSLLYEDLARRKFSHDSSTLPDISPPTSFRKDSSDGSTTARLPRFDELLASAPPALPETLVDPIQPLAPKPPPTDDVAMAASAAAAALDTEGEVLGVEDDASKIAFVVTMNETDQLLGENVAMDAADKLDASKDESKIIKGMPKTGGEDDSSSFESSTGKKVLMEAVMLATGTGLNDGGANTTSSWATAGGSGPSQGASGSGGGGGGGGRERNESLSIIQGLQPLGGLGLVGGRDRLGSLGSALDASDLLSSRRDRLESWGGMSDLSGALQLSSTTTGAANHTNSIPGNFTMTLMQTNDDGEVTVPEIGFPSSDTNNQALLGRHGMNRDRLNSLASASEASLTGFPMQVEGIDVTIDIQAFVSATVASMSDQLAEIASAVELVGTLGEDAILRRDPDDDDDGEDDDDDDDNDDDDDDDDDDHNLNESLDVGSDASSSVLRRRPRSQSVNSGILSVDRDALAVAVDAASAAAAAFDLEGVGRKHSNSFGSALSLSEILDTNDCDDEAVEDEPPKKKRSPPRQRKKKEKLPSSPFSSKPANRRSNRRPLPLSQRTRGGSEHSSGSDQAPEPHKKSSMDKKEEAELRQRARAAVSARCHPLKKRVRDQGSCSTATSASSRPLKKRAKRNSSGGSDKKAAKPPPASTPFSSLTSSHVTPKQSNRTVTKPDDVPVAPLVPSSGAAAAGEAATLTPVLSSCKPANDKANQKWDSMFDQLLNFIDDRRAKETEGLPEEEQDMWIWDGNVPTNHKTEDGKALGRWVNNQRTAKVKGALRDDRIRRLEDAGLKWSVLPANAWNESLEELRLYVQERTKDGSEWDGNVPTNYQIKARPDGKFVGEDRNLGRWVNRQRSQYQAGKLRKDRQLALENLGLKWCMLEFTAWDSMYEILLRYIEEQRKGNRGRWDGNVPTNYKTPDHPPKSLGRWINRQRTAHYKKKLKQEYVDKLNRVGLRWSVHERVTTTSSAAAATTSMAETDQDDNDCDLPVESSVRCNNGNRVTPDFVVSKDGNGGESNKAKDPNASNNKDTRAANEEGAAAAATATTETCTVPPPEEEPADDLSAPLLDVPLPMVDVAAQQQVQVWQTVNL